MLRPEWVNVFFGSERGPNITQGQEKKTATIINFTKTVFYTEALKVFLYIKILDINSVYICIMYNKCVNPRYCIEIKFSLRNNAETQQQSISNLNLKVNVSSIV